MVMTTMKNLPGGSAAVLALALLFALAPAARAEDAPARDTKQTVAMSQPVYEKLQEIQQLVEAKDYAAAHAGLDALRQRKKLSVYEKAQIWNLTAYAYYLQENYAKSANAYEQVLTQGDVPEALVQSTLKTLAQLHFTLEDYTAALQVVQRLVQLISEPGADIYMLMGQAYFQLERYREALQPIRTGIQLSRAQGVQPKENWLLLLRVIHYELKDYPAMLAVLKELMQLYPRDRYLLDMAAVYSELGDTAKQLSLTEVLYESGYIEPQRHAVNLANLYLLHGVPHKAAMVLQQAVRDGHVEANERNLRLLSQAWYQAREDAKAVPPLQRAAALSEDGELYVRLAQTYINLERWEEVEDAIRKGMAKGGLRQPGTANMMLGIALFNRHNLRAARTAFEQAGKHTNTRKAAGQWLTHIDSELQRRALLESSATPTTPATPAAPAAQEG